MTSLLAFALIALGEMYLIVETTSNVTPIFSTSSRIRTVHQKRIQRHSNREDYTVIAGVGSYKVHTEAVNWETAKLICEKEGGHLAVMNSDTEATEVVKLFVSSLPKQSGSFHAFYAILGFFQRSLGDEFVTVFGEPLEETGYYKWAKTEPNNLNGNEHCGSIDGWGGLNDINCDHEFSFICELSNATSSTRG